MSTLWAMKYTDADIFLSQNEMKFKNQNIYTTIGRILLKETFEQSPMFLSYTLELFCKYKNVKVFKNFVHLNFKLVLL